MDPYQVLACAIFIGLLAVLAYIVTLTPALRHLIPLCHSALLAAMSGCVLGGVVAHFWLRDLTDSIQTQNSTIADALLSWTEFVLQFASFFGMVIGLTFALCLWYVRRDRNATTRKVGITHTAIHPAKRES